MSVLVILIIFFVIAWLVFGMVLARAAALGDEIQRKQIEYWKENDE